MDIFIPYLKDYNSGTANSIAFKWSSIFFLVSTVLIYFTDLVLYQQIAEYSLLSTYHTFKGILFLSLISMGGFVLIRHLISKLKQKNESLLYALESSKMATWIYDVKTQEINRSCNHHTLYGYKHKPARWNLSRFLVHIPKIDRQRIKKELYESINSNGNIDTILPISTKSGQICWRLLKGRVTYDSHNYPARISGIIMDIDERKKAEYKIREKEDFIETYINSIPGIFFILNKDGYLIRWNDNAKTLSGLSDRELDHLYAIERVVDKDQPKAKRALEEVLTKGESHVNLSLKTHLRQRAVFKITANRLEKDGEQFIVGTGINITDLVEKREKIQRQKYQLETTQVIAKLGYWENDCSEGKLRWTDTVYELFGLDKEEFELTLDNFLDLIHPKDRKNLVEGMELSSQSATFQSEYRLMKADGTLGWFREIGEVFAWENNRPKIIHGIVMDITHQKEAEKETKKSLLRGENKERRRIANELHDGIAQYLSAALLHLDNLNPLQDNWKENNTKKIYNARKLIKNALTETQAISQNLIPRNIEKQGLTGAVKSLIRQYELSSDIAFCFDYNPEDFDDHSISEVETNLYRILQELLSNAVRHSDCDHVYVRLQKNRKSISCSIRDNGNGQELPELSEAEGFGLRSIHYRLQLLSGSIEFNNEPNKGLNVNIDIPLN